MNTSPDSPILKKLRDNLKSVDSDKIQCYREKLKSCLTVSEIDNLLEFYRNELIKEIVSDDYQGNRAFCFIFLVETERENLKFDLQVLCTMLDGWRCVQEHEKIYLYSEYKKQNLKRKFKESCFLNIILNRYN